MIICTKCKDVFDIGDENIKPVYIDNAVAGWQHKECEKQEEDKNEK